MATLRFRSAREMWGFVAVFTLVGGGLIARLLLSNGLPTDADGVRRAAAKRSLACTEAMARLRSGVGPLSGLQDTPTTPAGPVPHDRAAWSLPPALSTGAVCSWAFEASPLDTPDALEAARRALEAPVLPKVVLLSSLDCGSVCRGVLAWVDVDTKQVIGVKRLESKPSGMPFETERWVSSR